MLERLTDISSVGITSIINRLIMDGSIRAAGQAHKKWRRQVSDAWGYPIIKCNDWIGGHSGNCVGGVVTDERRQQSQQTSYCGQQSTYLH